MACMRGLRRTRERGAMVYVHKGCLGMDAWDDESHISERLQDGLTRVWMTEGKVLDRRRVREDMG